MKKIDFVILWVDGSDPEWLEQKNKYSPQKVDYSSGDNRFRDWNNLQYFFRGIEKFAPWVNNIYFITWGHIPKWLDTSNPKLKIVRHDEFIPKKYLPTFNSNTIELNLHRIHELSEHFVLFNDDTFIIDKVSPKDFFQKGLPKDELILNPILPKGEKYRISYTNLNNMNIINTYFNKNSVIKKYPKKVFSLKYGKELFRTFLLMPWSSFVGFTNPHLPNPHLKSTFSLLWKKENEKLNASCMNRFRGLNDLSHWLMRYWNLCSGKFVPRDRTFGKFFILSQNNSDIVSHITERKTKTICINDMSTDFDFDTVKSEINSAFEKILHEKSSFEL